MTSREEECFDALGGYWGESHSKVLKWADNHPSDDTIKKICLLDEAWDDAGGLSGTKLGFIDYIKKHWEEMNNDLDNIVDRYHKEIDEVYLNNLYNEYRLSKDSPFTIEEDFKAGYRKAKEE